MYAESLARITRATFSTMSSIGPQMPQHRPKATQRRDKRANSQILSALRRLISVRCWETCLSVLWRLSKNQQQLHQVSNLVRIRLIRRRHTLRCRQLRSMRRLCRSKILSLRALYVRVADFRSLAQTIAEILPHLSISKSSMRLSSFPSRQLEGDHRLAKEIHSTLWPSRSSNSRETPYMLDLLRGSSTKSC